MKTQEARKILKDSRWSCPKCKRSLPCWINREDHIRDCDGSIGEVPPNILRAFKELNKI